MRTRTTALGETTQEPNEEERMPLQGEYAPSTSKWARDQAETYEATAGQEASELRGRPVIVLTTVGAKSGRLRKTALMRVEHEGEYAVVASQGGHPEHPAWYFNMVAHPHVELQDGPVKRDYLAREVTGDEKTEWWARATVVWPPYDDYQAKTDRQIPLFVLTPFDPDAG
jgi:deazaflavin-dependent oxidoreductase (nitroreductase family)